MNIKLAPRSEQLMTYEEAILYCAFCTYDGHTDWRMPNPSEWENAKMNVIGWYLGRNSGLLWPVTPVRNV